MNLPLLFPWKKHCAWQEKSEGDHALLILSSKQEGGMIAEPHYHDYLYRPWSSGAGLVGPSDLRIDPCLQLNLM